MPSANEQTICKRKRRFASEAEAKAALTLIGRSWKLHKPNRAYKCPVCGGWHLTASKRR